MSAEERTRERHAYQTVAFAVAGSVDQHFDTVGTINLIMSKVGKPTLILYIKDVIAEGRLLLFTYENKRKVMNIKLALGRDEWSSIVRDFIATGRIWNVNNVSAKTIWYAWQSVDDYESCYEMVREAGRAGFITEGKRMLWLRDCMNEKTWNELMRDVLRELNLSVDFTSESSITNERYGTTRTVSDYIWRIYIEQLTGNINLKSRARMLEAYKRICTNDAGKRLWDEFVEAKKKDEENTSTEIWLDYHNIAELQNCRCRLAITSGVVCQQPRNWFGITSVDWNEIGLKAISTGLGSDHPEGNMDHLTLIVLPESRVESAGGIKSRVCPLYLGRAKAHPPDYSACPILKEVPSTSWTTLGIQYDDEAKSVKCPRVTDWRKGDHGCYKCIRKRNKLRHGGVTALPQPDQNGYIVSSSNLLKRYPEL